MLVRFQLLGSGGNLSSNLKKVVSWSLTFYLEDTMRFLLLLPFFVACTKTYRMPDVSKYTEDVIKHYCPQNKDIAISFLETEVDENWFRNDNCIEYETRLIVKCMYGLIINKVIQFGSSKSCDYLKLKDFK